MDPIWWIVLGVVVVLVLVGLLIWAKQRRSKRSDRLRKRFSTEYERTTSAGNRKQAERDLEHRIARRDELHLTSLDENEAEDVRTHIDDLLRSFVDGPDATARAMTQLVGQIAVARGYVATEEGVLDLVSVDHPETVAGLRRALSDMDNGKDRERTEACRQACREARTLAERLLAEGRAGQLPAERSEGEPPPEADERPRSATTEGDGSDPAARSQPAPDDPNVTATSTEQPRQRGS